MINLGKNPNPSSCTIVHADEMMYTMTYCKHTHPKLDNDYVVQVSRRISKQFIGVENDYFVFVKTYENNV